MIIKLSKDGDANYFCTFKYVYTLQLLFHFCGFYFDSHKIYTNHCVTKISEDEVSSTFVLLNNYSFSWFIYLFFQSSVCQASREYLRTEKISLIQKLMVDSDE